MFTHRNFDVEIVREFDLSKLGWPEPGEATDDSGLGCNRLYLDLRRLSWAEAKRVFALEGELIARIEAAEDTDAEYEAIEDELYESDVHLFGLDLGVASTVVSLSAARCLPFSSCNAGAFGGRHQEAYPVVAFYTRPQMVDLLLASAAAAEIGLEGGCYGYVVAYADHIYEFRRFAESLINKRSSFRAIRTPRRPRRPVETVTSTNASEQYSLPFG
jgi:hypothetical protein